MTSEERSRKEVAKEAKGEIDPRFTQGDNVSEENGKDYLVLDVMVSLNTGEVYYYVEEQGGVRQTTLHEDRLA